MGVKLPTGKDETADNGNLVIMVAISRYTCNPCDFGDIQDHFVC